MIRPIVHRLLRHHAKHRQWGSWTMAALALRYIQDYYINDSDLHSNGEAALLARMASPGIRSVFDVGANVGDWTSIALRCFPDATIHAFEVTPATSEQLRARFPDGRVAITNMGLSDCPGTANLHFNREDSLISTLDNEVAKHRFGRYESVTVPLTTGDAYCLERSVAHIDLLKIDTEGYDLRVLRGFGKMIQNRGVRAIQFERNQDAVYAHVFLRDFYDLLGDEFIIGRITPIGVDFQPYHWANELVVESTFFAILEEDKELFESVKTSKPGLRWEG